ncbi:MAG: hypothetical protein IPP40_04935 [bacterium]|nr:hypothetical protein [bacterium]
MQRFAKALAVGVSLIVTSIFVEFDSIRYLSLLTVALIVLWMWAVRYAGQRFDELTSK